MLIINAWVIFGLSTCTPINHSDIDLEYVQVTKTSIVSQVRETPTRSLTAQPSHTPNLPLTALEGPLLLIQTGFHEYQYLNPKNQTNFPVELPVQNPQFRLSSNLSPSGTRMFFPQDDHTGLIIDLIKNELIHIYDFKSPGMFNPQLAFLEAQAYFDEQEITEEFLLSQVTQAYQQSKQIIRWYQSDRYHLSVLAADKTSTSLFLDDHQSGVRLRLEDQPGLVIDYWVGPDPKQILLKKGFVFEPGAWEGNRYYLLNVEEQSSQYLLLPDGVNNPSVSWFSEDAIGVIHQRIIRGGSGFSIINTTSLESTQVISGDFTHFRRIGDQIFLLRWDNELRTTTFELLTLEGEPVSSQAVNSACNLHTMVSNRIILNCENVSLQVDINLEIQTIGDPVQILSPSPDRNTMALVYRSENSVLLDAEMRLQHNLELEGTPLEIRWLPDSTGFLYRTRGQLYLFDLSSQTSSLLLESDLFSDYININAVWVNLE